MEIVIEIRDLWFGYGGHTVLKDVNLELERGEFLAILGPNGGGKTTLLKLVLGIYQPDRGEIRVLGREPEKVRRRIGYVPQDPSQNKEFPISVLDVVLMGRLGTAPMKWRYSRSDVEVARRALDQVEMWDFRDRHMGELSGGQRQRVTIARALACEPDILLLDEPTASVDSRTHTDLYRFLHELNKTVTVVVVSHDVSILSTYVKSVACVNQTLFFHHISEMTQEMLDSAYRCPVELVTHGSVPHRVLRIHEDE